MAISDWPKAQRPRERLLERGAETLTDAELLAIFLRTGTTGLSALALAQNLLDQFGGLNALLSANQQQFCQAHGVGTAKFAQLRACSELTRRSLAEIIKREDVISSPSASKHFLSSRLASLRYEVFACLFLDTRNRVIAYEELFRGTVDQSSVYPREVVAAALKHNASALIFAHNHPSGLCDASEADHLITKRLQKALGLIDIKVLDHFIIGTGQLLSFAEQGYL